MRSLHGAVMLCVAVTSTLATTTQAVAQFDTPSRATTRKRTPAEPSNTIDVNALIENGIAAYKKRDYATAESYLTKAWQLSPTALIAATLATTEMKLKHFRAAGEHWSAYVRGLAHNQAQERAEALAQIAICRENAGTVRFVVEPSDADVDVDSNEVDLSAVGGELWLEPGEHSFFAHKALQKSELRRLTLKAGDDLQVRLAIPPPAAERLQLHRTTSVEVRAVDFRATPESTRGLTPKTVVLIGETALTLVALGIGVGYVIAFEKADSNAQSLREALYRMRTDPTTGPCAVAQPPSACATLSAEVDERSNAGRIVNFALPTAVILGAITLGTYFLWPDSETSALPASGISVSPWWSDKTKGASMQLAF